MSGIEGEVLGGAVGGAFALFALTMVNKKMDKIAKEICMLREAFFILTDAQTEEIKKKSGQQGYANLEIQENNRR